MKAEKIQLEDDENILLYVRKHWFILALRVFSLFIIAILPPIFGYGILTLTALPLPEMLHAGHFTAFYSCWLILIWISLFSIWTNYYLDIWIVTNKRLIAIDQQHFFSRSIASFRLERMQDILTDVSGIIPTFLDYGTIEIQTAGSEERFTVHGVPSPSEIKSVMLESADKLISGNSNIRMGL